MLGSLGENEAEEAEGRGVACCAAPLFTSAKAAVWPRVHHSPTIPGTILLLMLGAQLQQRDCMWFKINTVYLGHKHARGGVLMIFLGGLSLADSSLRANDIFPRLRCDSHAVIVGHDDCVTAITKGSQHSERRCVFIPPSR